MPYGRILKANMVPSGACLLHILVNNQIFSEIKLSVKNRNKKRNVRRFTITVRRMYIFCKPCPTACMTLSFRCGSGKRLTELVRIVQRFAHGTWPSVWREPFEKYPACTWIWQEYEGKRSSAGQEPEVPVGPPSAVRNGLSYNPAEFRHKRDEQLRFYNSGYVLPYGTKTGCGEKSHPLHPLPAFKIADLEHESGTQGLYVHDHAILKVHYRYLPQTYPQTVLDASDSRNK